MSPHFLTHFGIQKHYQNKPRFNDACSRDRLLKVTSGAWVTNLDEYSDIETHWNAIYVKILVNEKFLLT